MKVNVKVKKVVGTREWNDKQTGEARKVTTVVAEEINNEQYKDSFVIEFFDKHADAFKENFKEGDKVQVSVAHRAQCREYEKDGEKRTIWEQKISGFGVAKL